MPESATLALGFTVIAIAVIAVARRIDVRLVLILAALALGGIAGDVTPVVRRFLSTLSSEQFVIPICTAMGFAQVLRHSGCDLHLVHALVAPIRRVRFLLIPGAVLVGAFVNVSVISQAATSVAVGTVLIPLLRSARFSATTVGAALLLGASIGGELLNPGAPEINTVARTLKVDPSACVQNVAPLLAIQIGVAVVLFWVLSLRAERRAPRSDDAHSTTANDGFRLNPFKAVVPIIPLVLLMVVGPPFNLVQVPKQWLVEPQPLAPLRPEMNDRVGPAFDRIVRESERASYGSRLIGVSMLIGTVLAGLAAPSSAFGTARVFFEGAGLALTRIVSVIVAATCFGEGIKLLHLHEPIRRVIGAEPEFVWLLGSTLTFGFALLSGSGMAATQSLYEIYAHQALGVDALMRVGAVVAISAAAGRTMSPVAAVVLTCANLAEANSLSICRRVAVPLIGATLVMVACAWWRG